MRAPMTEQTEQTEQAAIAPMDELQPAVIVLTTEKLGHHEVVRQAAAFARYFSAPVQQRLLAAATERQLLPARLTHLIRQHGDWGALALVEGQAVVLGQERFLALTDVTPHPAERAAGKRLEAEGYTVYYVFYPEHRRCLGLIGLRLSQ